MSRPKNRKSPHDLLVYLRNGPCMAEQARTKAGRMEMESWLKTLSARLEENQASVRELQECVDLIRAALGEVHA